MFLTVLTYVVSFGLWVLTYYLYTFPYPIPGQVGAFAENILPSSSIFAHIISFAFVVLNSLLLAQMNNKYSFIRTRTFMPTFIYLLLATCWLSIHGNYIANLASFLVLLVIFLTLGMYKNERAMEQAFLSSFILGLSSFLVAEFVYLIVLVWLGYFYLKCFSGKVFFASILGIITPWILLMSTLYLTSDSVDFLYNIPVFFYKYTLFSYENMPTNVYAIILALIVSISVFQMIAKSRQDSIQTRNELNFIKLIALGVVVLLLIRFSNSTLYLPTIAILYAILAAYSFTLIRNLFNSIVFVSLCAISFIFMFYEIIIQHF